MSGYISGVQNSYYYQSDYYLSLNRKLVSGEFFWGTLTGFFGGGVFYSERGLRTAAAGNVSDKENDFLLGPSLNIKWAFWGPAYIMLDALYGIREIYAHLTMSFQDVEVLSVGFNF